MWLLAINLFRKTKKEAVVAGVYHPDICLEVLIINLPNKKQVLNTHFRHVAVL